MALGESWTRESRRPPRQRPMDKERAWSLVFRRRTFKLVWLWLERLGVPIRDRRDVRQDVFLAAHQSWPSYDPLGARPERWLNRITLHIASRYRERALHRCEVLTSGGFEEIVDEGPGPDERFFQEERRTTLLDLLGEIDLDQRAVLVAHAIDGIPMAEVAEQRGIPLSTAYKWRVRALAALSEVAVERGLIGCPGEPLL